MNERPIALPFPAPSGPELSNAYKDLYLSAHGDATTKKRIGDPGLLPRPWDPPTCTRPPLRRELWQWLDEVVIWFNTEYVWDPTAGSIPPCWPDHPHLVHEIAVLADQRRRAGIDTSSNTLEEWHRYTVPAFLERLRARVRTNCDEHHQPTPARTRQARHVADAATAERERAFEEDATQFRGRDHEPARPGTQRSPLQIVDGETGNLIDPGTGELL